MLTKSWPCVRKPIGQKKWHFKIRQNVNAVCARQANRDWQAFNKRSSCAAVSLNQPSSPLQWNIFFHTIWKSSALNGGQVFPIQPCFLSVISIEQEEAHYRPVADGGALNRLRSPLLPGWRNPTALQLPPPHSFEHWRWRFCTRLTMSKSARRHH